MIVDNIKNASRYFSIDVSLEQIFKIILAFCHDDNEFVQEIDNGAYVSFCHPVLKNESEGVFEDHEKMVDVHYVISGYEIIDVADVSDLRMKEDHYKQDDYALFERSAQWRRIHLNPGDFVIIFPGEAHCPTLSATGAGETIKKAVGKFAYKQN